MFGKKKNTPAPAENGDVQFEKNIKTLWVYTLLFCAFALVLIIVSSIIQGKINSEAEYYQDQYENAQTSNQSTIKNIQDENAALKKDLAVFKSEHEKTSAENEQNKELLNNANELIENAEYLILALECEDNNDDAQAKAYLNKINPDMLSESMKSAYEALKTELA